MNSNYESWTLVMVKKELKRRGAKTSRRKAECVERYFDDLFQMFVNLQYIRHFDSRVFTVCITVSSILFIVGISIRVDLTLHSICIIVL